MPPEIIQEPVVAPNTPIVNDSSKSVTEMIEAARKEEKTKLYAQIEHEKKRADEAQKRWTEHQEAEKKRKLEALPAEDQTRARLSELEQSVEVARQEAAAVRRDADMQIRAMGLVAYREKALHAAGEGVISSLVGGASEAEIDQSIAVAREEFNRITRIVEARRPVATQAPPQGVPVPPYNPAYATHQNGGLPTPMAPAQTQFGQGGAPSGLIPVDEEAIRSGRYSGELRQQVLEQTRRLIQGGGAQGPMGVQPLYSHPAQQLPQVQMPGGIQQPVGSRMMPQYQPPAQQQYMPQQFLNPMPNGVPQQQFAPQAPLQQQQQYAPPQQQFAPQGGDPAIAEARAAVARTLAGQNPLVNHSDNNAPGRLGTQQALADANAYGVSNGVSPEAAFAARFGATPQGQ